MSLVDLLDYATSAFGERRKVDAGAAAGRRARADRTRDGRDEWDEDTVDETPEVQDEAGPRSISDARKP